MTTTAKQTKLTAANFTAGDRIQVKADRVLGTPAAMATVTEVHATFLTVHVDGDDPEWNGPVTFTGNVLC